MGRPETRPDRQDVGARPRLAGALFLTLDAMEAAAVWVESSSIQRTIQLSSGGRGAGGMWAMRGLGPRRALQNAHFREAMRIRLGCCRAEDSATCSLQPESAAEQPRTACGHSLRGPEGTCVHPFLCNVAAVRQRPHRACTTAWGRALRACGANVDYERHVPHLYKWDNTTQRFTEAILDVVTSWPGGSTLCPWDIVISCPHAARVRGADTTPGAAAMSGERWKVQRYGHGVAPLALETYGRMGPRSAEFMQQAAREATLFGCAVAPPGLLQRRWRQDIDLALAFAQADAALAAKGAAQRVAGAGFPIARVLRARSAAAGERAEQSAG